MSNAHPLDFPEEELSNMDSHAALEKILKKVRSVQKEVLVVFDNAEDIILNDKPSFLKLLMKFV
jgi:hypothetical protein